MKILHLSSEASWRGGEQQMAYLIAELQQQGIQPLVACRTGSAFADYCRRQSWKHVNLPFRNSFDVKTSLAIKRICSREKVDIVHIHSGKSHGIAVLAAALGSNVSLVLSRRVDFPIRQNRLTRWKYNHSQIKKILCVSQAIEKIVRSGVKHPERCITVHSGIDPTRFKAPSGYLRKRFSLSSETLLIGNTSALADHKDYFTFVDTAEIVLEQQPNTRFIIIGEGPEKERIKNYIAQKKLQEQVLMTGFLTSLDEVLSELNIFLMTSQTEGLGTSILDAFACRVPVVATEAGGIPEMVRHEETGLLAPIGNSEKLAEQLFRLINQPLLHDHLSRGAFQLLTQSFTHRVMAQQTFTIYHDVLYK